LFFFTGIKDITNLKLVNFAFKNVKNFIYLGSMLNADNKMNIEIAERIAKGNKSTLCQCKTNKIEISKEKHQNENI
jgi:hypothetical protein